MDTRSSSAVWLVGGTEVQFKTSKLPSRGEVLKVLFGYHIGEHLSLKDSIDTTSSLLLPVWEMARIPTKAPNHVVEHIRKLHAEWQGLKKHINRQSASDINHQQTFQESLNDLFDIAHRDAMSLVKIAEDRLFLEAQRERGRRGTMGTVDTQLALQEKRALKRKTAAESYALKVHAVTVSAAATVPTTAFTGDDDDDDDGSEWPYDPDGEP